MTEFLGRFFYFGQYLYDILIIKMFSLGFGY
jgi:hypothetical protein